MRKNVRRRLCVFLLSVCTFVLTACHGSKGLQDFVMPQEFDTGREYEITFWAKNDTNINQTGIYKKAIADFETLYPNITVKLKLYTDYGQIYNDVITNISTGTTPNVCITYPDHIATYQTGVNAVVPLEGLFADSRYGLGGSELRYEGPKQEEMIPEFLQECYFAGHYYAIPYMRSTEVCYVNKTYLEAMGYTLPETLTWDFVWEVSEAALQKDNNDNYVVNGQKVMIPFIYKSTDNMMITMLKQQNAGYSNEEGQIELFNDTTSEILKTVAAHAQTGAFSTFKISGYPANFFNAGQCIFAVDSTAGATWMGSRAPLSDISEDAFVDFETEVMTIPQTDPVHPKMISQGPSVCIFNKTDSQEVLASWLFAQYLLTDEVQMAYAETEGYVPVTARAQQTPAYQDYLARGGEDDTEHYEVKIKATRLLLENEENTFVTPVFNGSASLRDGAGQLIENVTKSVRRKQVVDDAYLEKLYQDITTLYRLGESGVAVSGKKDLGKLPTASVVLLMVLGVTWVMILACVVWNWRKMRKNAQ